MRTPRRIQPLTRERLVDLPGPTDAPRPDGWVESVLADWGHCGTVAEVDGEVVGYLTAAPAPAVPPAGLAGPYEPDGAVLLTAFVLPAHVRQGLGRQLVQGLAADLTKRRLSVIEAVGSPAPGAGDGHSPWPAPSSGPDPCPLPEGWLDAVGFRLVRDHPLTPRYRMDLSSAMRWKAPDLAAAWHRIRGLVSQPAPPEPAGFHRSIAVGDGARPLRQAQGTSTRAG